MDKQYSVEFFACFVDSVQKLCRDYLNFEQAVELSGYLCLEIDNSKKERYVLSELVQSSGDVISESYCTKAFKTVRKGPTTTVGYRGAENISPRYRLNQERGQREPPTSALYQHPASQFAIGIRDTRVGRNEKSQDTSTSSFMNRPSGPTSRGMTSGTDLMSSRLHHVKDSETRAIKRTASFPDDAPSSKKDTINTGSPSGVDETSISPEESIRLPLAVTVKQEHDVPFMVIDNPEGDMSEDQFHDSSEQGLGGGAENFIAARASAIGDSPEATERAPLLSRQIQIGISAGGSSVTDGTTPECKWGWDTGGPQHQQHATAKGQDLCSYCRQKFPRRELIQKDPYGSLCSKCSGVLGVKSDSTVKNSNNIMIPCTKCNEKFSQKAFLCYHMKSVHKDECSTDTEIDWDKLCESSYTKDLLSKQPQMNRVLKNFPCDLCDKSYTCNSMLLDHINSKHANRSYQCVCGAVFSWRSGLERHKKRCILITHKDISGNMMTEKDIIDIGNHPGMQGLIE
ncbi:uncharacterized protein LOC121384052 isoform X2 [Gigantopelta aegis]|uniref:uncharacterized protein LOC121384052 isoform X2 n=1 Tax=Gigantopelta aegis TaxID=1735272 RepID=UPI001B88B66B|nr:uncharacterized protein LOC121384052 isoform X2 [Gigantopelta aegis]